MSWERASHVPPKASGQACLWGKRSTQARRCLRRPDRDAGYGRLRRRRWRAILDRRALARDGGRPERAPSYKRSLGRVWPARRLVAEAWGLGRKTMRDREEGGPRAAGRPMAPSWAGMGAACRRWGSPCWRGVCRKGRCFPIGSEFRWSRHRPASSPSLALAQRPKRPRSKRRGHARVCFGATAQGPCQGPCQGP